LFLSVPVLSVPADNWNITYQAFFKKWIASHMDAARQMNKVGGC
jgi:hypothetical protein